MAQNCINFIQFFRKFWQNRMLVPPMAQNCLNFMQFFRKFWQNRMLVPPEGLMLPPTGNPGSAPEAERSHHLLSLGAACMLVK